MRSEEKKEKGQAGLHRVSLSCIGIKRLILCTQCQLLHFFTVIVPLGWTREPVKNMNQRSQSQYFNLWQTTVGTWSMSMSIQSREPNKRETARHRLMIKSTSRLCSAAKQKGPKATPLFPRLLGLNFQSWQDGQGLTSDLETKTAAFCIIKMVYDRPLDRLKRADSATGHWKLYAIARDRMS